VRTLFVPCSDAHAACFGALADATERLGHSADVIAVFPTADRYLASVGRKTIPFRGPLRRLVRHAAACDGPAVERLAAFEIAVSHGRIKRTIAKVVSALRQYWRMLLTGGDYDRVVLVNGCGFLHSVLVEQAQGLPKSPKIWYAEAGFFPNTMVLDPRGVNRRSILMDLAIEDLAPAAAGVDGFLDEWRRGPVQARRRSPRYGLWSHLRSLGMLDPAICALIGRSPWDVLRLAVSARLARRPSHTAAGPSAWQPYVFVPLQVHDDTQVLLNSPHFRDMASLVRHVVKHLPEGVRLVVKPHPADRGRTSLRRVQNALSPLGPRGVWVEDVPSTSLVAHAGAVVTLNSTVGFEAVAHLRPTCCLGLAWYAKPGLAHAPPDPDQLGQWILNPTPPDPESVRRMVSFLIHHYLVPGGFSGITPREADVAAGRILDGDLPLRAPQLPRCARHAA
jgi:hypothetical protein